MGNKNQENVEVHDEKTESKKSKGSKSKKEKLQAKCSEMEIELQEQKDKFLRLYAEFDNFKKRSVKEKMEFLKSASSDTMRILLPVLDDFDRAKTAAEDGDNDEKFPEGVNLVYAKLYSLLEGKGLKPMASDGETFDPEVHEAVTNAPAPSDDLKGKVLHTVEKGYYLNDRILRHAKVVVGN